MKPICKLGSLRLEWHKNVWLIFGYVSNEIAVGALGFVLRVGR